MKKQIIPFYIFDIDNGILIIDKTSCPETITDNQEIVVARQYVPGTNFEYTNVSGTKNRRLEFTITIEEKKLPAFKLLGQFKNLREQAIIPIDIFNQQKFTGTPRVLFKWGVSGIPLIYKVMKCDIENNALFTDMLGEPGLANISIGLELDGTNKLNLLEKAFSLINALPVNNVNNVIL